MAMMNTTTARDEKCIPWEPCGRCKQLSPVSSSIIGALRYDEIGKILSQLNNAIDAELRDARIDSFENGVCAIVLNYTRSNNDVPGQKQLPFQALAQSHVLCKNLHDPDLWKKLPIQLFVLLERKCLPFA